MATRKIFLVPYNELHPQAQKIAQRAHPENKPSKNHELASMIMNYARLHPHVPEFSDDLLNKFLDKVDRYQPDDPPLTYAEIRGMLRNFGNWVYQNAHKLPPQKATKRK